MFSKYLFMLLLGSSSCLFSMEYSASAQSVAARKIQAVYRGWVQRKRTMNGAIQVLSHFRTVLPDGTYVTRSLPILESQALFEGKITPMSELRYARQLFVRLGMTPFAHVISLESVGKQASVRKV